MKLKNILKNAEMLLLMYSFHIFFFVFFTGLFALPATIIARNVELIQDPALKSAITLLAGPEPVWVFYPGFVLSLVFLPLDIAILVSMVREYKKTGNIRLAFDEGIEKYPLYTLAFNAFVCMGFFAPYLFPFLLLGVIKWRNGRIRKKDILLTIAVVLWGTVGHKITYSKDLFLRRVFYVTTLLLIPPGVYIFSDDDGHGSPKNEETDLR